MLKKKLQPKYLAPSILSANFANLEKDLLACEQGGADYIHLDVMDGHFVPNLTFGAPIIKSLRKVSRLPFDTHLMVTEPEKFVEDFAKAGSDLITFHVEASVNPKALLTKIRGLGLKAGLSLRPGTHLKDIIPFLKDLDLILVMTVEPGFGGQEFMDSQLGKVKELVSLRQKHELDFLISVDGGINMETARKAVDAGADILVAGSFVFKNHPVQALRDLRKLPL